MNFEFEVCFVNFEDFIFIYFFFSLSNSKDYGSSGTFIFTAIDVF